MLSRAIIRSLRTPTAQASPATFRIASSTVWSRSMARHNRPNHGHKKQAVAPQSPGNTTTSRPGGATAAFTSPRQNSQSSDRPGRSEFPRTQGEVIKGTTHGRNANLQSGGTGFVSANNSAKEGEGKALPGKQDEFDTAASPSQSSPPRSPAPSAVDPVEAQVPPQPLPDLTQGIPSTLEYETTGSTTKAPLNLTEAAEPTQSGGGRGRGELPASAYISSSERKRLKFANYMYAMFALLSVSGTVYLGRNWESEDEENQHPDAPSGWALGLMWNRAKARLGDQLNYYNEPAFQKLLPDTDPIFERPYTLVLSLENLLIHSEWSREHGWRMAKRPGVDYFLRYLSQYYELVIFTSQPWAVAEPVIRKLDPYHIVTWPLFREATLYENGEYVKASLTTL